MFTPLLGPDIDLPTNGFELYQYFNNCFEKKNLEALQTILLGLCAGDPNSFVFGISGSFLQDLPTKKYNNISDEEKEAHATSRRYFVRKRASDIVREFSEQTQFPTTNKYEYNFLLHLAVKANWCEGVEYLLSHGAKINSYSYQLSHDTRTECYPETARYCLAQYSTPLVLALEYTSGHGKLSGAELEENKRILNLLLQRGADVRLHTTRATPLHLAVKERRYGPELVRSLITKGADVNALDIRSRSPLSYADYDTAQLLIANGADTNIQYDLSHKYGRDYEQIDADRAQSNFNANLALIEKLEIHRNEKLLNSSTNSPLAKTKAEIINEFILFLKINLSCSPKEIIKDFTEQYQQQHDNENPFAKLQEQRNVGFVYKFFLNPDYTASIQIFQKYLGKEKTILEPYFQDENVVAAKHSIEHRR